MGESESKIRQAIMVAESLSPCILWIDELDKAFAGVRGYQGDSGTRLQYRLPSGATSARAQILDATGRLVKEVESWWA